MKIVVLAGGTSTERDVSFSSGKKIYHALKEKGHQVILLDVYMGLPGRINNLFEEEREWDKDISDIKEEAPDIRNLNIHRTVAENRYFGENVIAICQMADMVFIALHGENGENGKLQAAFDLLGINYTGSDYLGAALAMDKCLAKEILSKNHIKTPRHIRMTNKITDTSQFTFPKVIKVANGGSSIGVYIVDSEEEYNQKIQEAYTIENDIMIEEYIKGREFSVGILDGKALPVIEIIPKTSFYDYKNKYQAGSTLEICPAEVPFDKSKEMQVIAEKVYQVLRLKVYARIDFIMSEKDKEIFCLEANTLPGMTPTSLLPQEASVIGITYSGLCERIIELSLKK